MIDPARSRVTVHYPLPTTTTHLPRLLSALPALSRLARPGLGVDREDDEPGNLALSCVLQALLFEVAATDAGLRGGRHGVVAGGAGRGARPRPARLLRLRPVAALRGE